MKSMTLRMLIAALLAMAWFGETHANPLPSYYYVTVTFDANGGTVSKTSIRQRCDKKIGTLPTPKREGYMFEGWYTERTGGWQISSSTVIWDLDGYETVTVYAHWRSGDGGGRSWHWQKARTLTGVFETCDGGLGVCELKCGKANAKGIAKVSLKFTMLNGKRVNYNAVSVDVSGGDEVYVIFRGRNGGTGSYGVWIVEDSSGFEPDHVWFDGTNIDGFDCPTYEFSGCTHHPVGGNLSDGRYSLEAWIDSDDLFSLQFGDYCLNSYLLMPFCEYDYNWSGVNPQKFSIRGKKWDFGRVPSLKYKVYKHANEEYDWWDADLIGLSDDKPNYPATRISYNPKTGFFKGTFNLLLDPIVCTALVKKPPTTLKKVPFKVSGVIVDGTGTGIATTSKKPIVTCFVDVNPY